MKNYNLKKYKTVECVRCKVKSTTRRCGSAFTLTKKPHVRLVLQTFFRRYAMSHLTKQERCKIENFLFAGVTPQKTARNLVRSHTTINRELKRHRIEEDPDHRKCTNYCLYSRQCKKFKVCKLPPSSCLGKCSRCRIVSYAQAIVILVKIHQLNGNIAPKQIIHASLNIAPKRGDFRIKKR